MATIALILLIAVGQSFSFYQPSISFTDSSSSTIPYLSLSVSLANKLHEFMLNKTTNAYDYEVSSNWASVVSKQYSTLGNAFIIAGMIQLYRATGNLTYLKWASSTSEQFWDHAWDSKNQGFYDDYHTNWVRETCQQTTQNNAMWGIDFLNLYQTNGSSTWLSRANQTVMLINNRFWNQTENVVLVSSNVCTNTPSSDVHIEVSIGSYLWLTSQWSQITGSNKYNNRMSEVASFARDYLWDSSSNNLSGGVGSTDCTKNSNYLGFMRSAFANHSGLEDCRKGVNENIWGAMGLAYLYSLTGNATIKPWITQDLNWINQTFWDPTHGGFHQDAYRNDTLRSACSSTNNPLDYPGWTQGEQPWFWWQIGQLLNDNAFAKWALVSEQWTVQHQWNYTNNNGGDMTCLNSNTSPDLGSPNANLYDWIQGSALYSFSTIAELGTSSTSSSVTTSSSTATGSASSSSTTTLSTTITSSLTSSSTSTISSTTGSTSKSTSSTSTTLTNGPSCIANSNYPVIGSWVTVSCSKFPPSSTLKVTIFNNSTKSYVAYLYPSQATSSSGGITFSLKITKSMMGTDTIMFYSPSKSINIQTRVVIFAGETPPTTLASTTFAFMMVLVISKFQSRKRGAYEFISRRTSRYL